MARSHRPFPANKPSPANALRAAVEHFNAGRLSEAEFALRLVLTARPNDGDALNLLGGIALQKGNLDKALSLLERAAAAKPNDAGMHFNLAGVYRRSGQLDKALEHYEIAARVRRGHAPAEALKGDLLKEMGEWARAQAAFETALQYDRHLFIALNGRGECFLNAGDYDAAREAFTAALDELPLKDNENRARLKANIGVALIQLGEWKEGLAALAEASSLAPDNNEILLMLARNLRHVRVIPEGEAFRQLLARIFDHPSIDPRGLSSVAAVALCAEIESADAAISDALIETLSGNALLLSHLRNAPVTDAALELVLTDTRRALVFAAVESGAMTLAPHLEFICALARQCYLNEYVWSMTAEEEQAVDLLCADLGSDDRWIRLALTACYRPLASVVAADLGRDGAPEPLLAVLRQQVDEPAEEASLAATMVALTPITDKTSQSVRQQYEENPYPRWVRVGARAPLPFRRAVHQRLPHLRAELLPQTDTPHVLVAGCGTGLETMQVVNAFNLASLLAVDLSRASLGYGARKLREKGITNVTHRQGDILELGRLEDRFDLVHSFGVIHHMAEPTKGLAVLSGLLKPGAYLFVGLYSTIARRPLMRARQIIAERAIPATQDGIRGFRRELMTGNANPGLAILASPASDFWTMSECRDLIFHVEEHQYTLLEIADMFATEGLEFLGIEVPYAADLAAFRRQHPDPAALMSLAAWHEFEEENSEVFGGTYRLWARKPN